MSRKGPGIVCRVLQEGGCRVEEGEKYENQKNALDRGCRGPGLSRGFQGTSGGVRRVQLRGVKTAKNTKTVWLGYYTATFRILCRRFQ